ncbi:hypothetical protein GCM10020295_63310 [Streptomyces cinereospinus]
MPDDEDDRAGQQGLPDPAGGGLRLAARHHEGEDEHGDDGGLGGEVPGGDGDEGPADGDQRDQPLGPGQHRRAPGEEERAEHGSGGTAQHTRDEWPEVGLDEEDDGGGEPVPVLVRPVPLGVAQRLGQGDAGAHAQGDAQAVLPAAGPQDGPQQVPGRAPPAGRVAALAAVEGLGGVQQGVVEGAQGGQ